jgi:hypothetical protein
MVSIPDHGAEQLVDVRRRPVHHVRYVRRSLSRALFFFARDRGYPPIIENVSPGARAEYGVHRHMTVHRR